MQKKIITEKKIYNDLIKYLKWSYELEDTEAKSMILSNPEYIHDIILFAKLIYGVSQCQKN